MKFSVNDTVKAKCSGPNGHYAVSIHDEGTVISRRTYGRHEYYTVKFESLTGTYWGNRNRDGEYEITAGNLVLSTPGTPPPPPPVYTEQETIDLALKVVAVMRKYAKKHRLCKVADEALIEAGLEAYMNVTKTVKVTTEVEVSVAPGSLVDDETFAALALEQVRSGAVDLTTKVG